MKSYLCLPGPALLCTAINLFFLLGAINLNAQVTSFPKDYQLYPRNLSTNRATINISGTLNQTTGYTRVRLYVYRDEILINTISNTLSFNNGVAAYSISTEIPAELNNYRFTLFGGNQWTETQLRTAANVVAGDAFIIQGQSNAVASLRGSTANGNNADDYSNTPFRSFVRVYGSGNTTASYSKAWFVAKSNVWYDVDGQAGQWGTRLGSNLAGANQVPICIFNGGMPGEPLSYFQRNDNNPRSIYTNYGRLLRRVEESGLKNNIRALVWYQGESDNQGTLNSTQMSTQQYKSGFNNLSADWKSDFPGLNKFYIVQIRFGCGISSPDNCLKVQEAQRQLDKESVEVLTISSNNTNHLYEGGALQYCHYNFLDGYKNIGDWISNLLRRDLYNTSMPASIEAPEPETASFTQISSSGEASQIALTLKNQQSSFSMIGDHRNLFRLDGGNFSINAVTINGNIITLNFSRLTGTSNNPTGISYRSHDGLAAPVITNNSGLGLIHFEYFPISGNTAPPPPTTPTVCIDRYESNNTASAAKSLPHNSTIQASIENSTDEDWFNVRIWEYQYFRIQLTNLPEDYDLYLYSTTGELIRSLTTTGTGSEILKYNDGLKNVSYRLKVIGKNGVSDPSRCYSLLLEAFSSPLADPTPPPPTDPTPPPTDPAPVEVCPDSFEPNNSLSSAKSLGHNTNYTASIENSTDEDWYNIRIWTFQYFKISLWSLPADYDLYLYDPNGNLLRSSIQDGNTAEVINYNDGVSNTSYLVKVVSKSGTTPDPGKCYQIRLEAFSSPLSASSPPYGSGISIINTRPMEEMNETIVPYAGFKTYPNPAISNLQIEYNTNNIDITEFRIIDLTGKAIMINRQISVKGINRAVLKFSHSIKPGNYFIQMIRKEGIITRKLLINGR